MNDDPKVAELWESDADYQNFPFTLVYFTLYAANTDTEKHSEVLKMFKSNSSYSHTTMNKPTKLYKVWSFVFCIEK